MSRPLPEDVNQWLPRDRNKHAEQCGRKLKYLHGIETNADGHYVIRIDRLKGQTHGDVMKLLAAIVEEVACELDPLRKKKVGAAA
jgi:hypothetical protein